MRKIRLTPEFVRGKVSVCFLMVPTMSYSMSVNFVYI